MKGILIGTIWGERVLCVIGIGGIIDHLSLNFLVITSTSITIFLYILSCYG